jgi:hypothetical protein
MRRGVWALCCTGRLQKLTIMDENFRAYESVGQLLYADQSAIDCRVFATHEHDGSLRLDCLTSPGNPPPQWFGQRLGANLFPVRYVGTVIGGKPIEVSGRFLPAPMDKSIGTGSQNSYHVSFKGGMQVGTPPAAVADAEWRFAITNFLFDGRPAPNGNGAEELQLQLGRCSTRLVQVPDYKNARSFLQARRRIRVTATAQIPGSIPLSNAMETAADLVSLLSIAKGTYISWICCDLVSLNGETLYSDHHPAITRPYNGALPLIDPRGYEELPQFLETVFQRFQELRTERGLRMISQAIADIRTDGFLEGRSLQALSTLEFMIGKHAAVKDREFYVHPLRFQVIRSDFTKIVRKVLRLALPEVNSSQTDGLVEHLQGINFTSFGRRTKGMANDLTVELDGGDPKQVKETRNDLVHRAKFNTAEPFAEFCRILYVVDRLLLGLLGYSGPYIDARTMKRAEPPSTQPKPTCGDG